MTPSLEEIRRTVISTFKTLVDASYPTLLVEYPNRTAADREHLTGPFVSVDIELSSYMEKFGISDEEMIIKGRLVVYYLYTDNTGMNGSAAFLDSLKDTFCYKQISGITYQDMAVYNVYPSPGIVGQKAVLKFMA